MGNKKSKNKSSAFDDYWWFWDCRPDTWKKGKPHWKMYEDHKSVAIEVKYNKWLKSGKNEVARAIVSPDYYIDFAKMIQVFVYDENRIRPVKRGK